MNILVVRTDKLGDFITALPAIYVLKQHNPKNKIIVCVAPLNRELAVACEFIDEVIVDDGLGMWSFVKKLWHVKADASITLFSNTRVAFAQFLARIPIRIAPATKIAQIFYTSRVKQRRSEVKMAEFEYNLALTKELFSDIDLSYKKPLLDFKIDKSPRSGICFHVGFGGSSDANWTLDEYVELIDEALKNHKITLTFGPDETELMQTMKEKLKAREVEFYLSNSGIVEFAKYITRFRLFVSTSTGTYHLASLVGTPTMTFFADSLFASFKRWKAIGDEKLQQHFMIAHAKDKRQEVFESVKISLSKGKQ
ncbi:MAG: glycosyltransferase family 9 protein [Campylobacterota bacterium]|nr:glycosyltransferase family 9 protein [Campylobacterota bacterium]